MEYDAQKASQDGAAREAAKLTPLLADRASTNNKEATSCVQELAAANMAAIMFLVETRRQEMAGAAQHRAVAKCSTALVLTPLGNKALAPMMPLALAPSTAVSSPPPPPPYNLCGCGPKPLQDTSCPCTIALPIDYGPWPPLEGTSPCPTLLPHWSTPLFSHAQYS